ncbi:MAG: outer membrane protein [Hyphomicrobiales bacterium]
MRKMFLATTALAMLSGIGAASAADLPTRKGPPMAPVYVPPAFTWTGFYVGVNAGYGWGNNNRNDSLPLGAIPVGGFFPTGGGNNNGGFVGGGQLGYNYQFGVGQGVVIGAEADLDYADIGRNRNSGVPYTFATTPGTTFFPNTGGGNGGGYLGTVRARLGYAFDRFLVYGTGGLAYGDIGRRGGNGFAVTQAGFVNPFTGAVVGATTSTPLGTNGSSSRAGWTIGGGVEYAVWQNWSVKAEYLYYNLGNGKNNTAFAPFFGTTRHNNQDGSIVRVGLNYKFW